jgi:hypothetical protein
MLTEACELEIGYGKDTMPRGVLGLNAELCEQLMFLGLPAPLFTIEIDGVPRLAFQRFFDSLAPTFDHMISLGQSNTIVSCPALTLPPAHRAIAHSRVDPAGSSRRSTARLAHVPGSTPRCCSPPPMR